MKTKLLQCGLIALSAMFLAGCSSEQKTETPVTESVLLYYGSLMSDAAGTGYEAESSAALYGLPKEIYPVKPFDGMSGKVKGVIVRTEDQYGETDPDIIVYGENGYKTKAEYTDKYDRYEYEFSMKWTGDNKLVEESKLLHEDAEGGYDAVYTIDGILDRSSEVEFDENKRPVRRCIYWHTEYEEDESGTEHLVPAKKPKLYSEENWKYDANGNIIEYSISLWGRTPDKWTMTYSEDGKSMLAAVHVDSDGTEEKVGFRYFADMPGKPAEVTFYNQNGNRQKRHWLSYDAAGNLAEAVIEEAGRLSHEVFGPAGVSLRYSTPTYNSSVSYEFDAVGNWTKKTEKSDYGVTVSKRQVTYY